MARMAWDVVVVGGGHAGCEAAAAAARCGARTLLVTHSIETIGVMSCNPAVGGVGKGHLVREVDALDGLIARAADAAGIHFKVLNRSKGPAVRGPRVQTDRALFRAAMLSLLRETSGLDILAGAVEALIQTPDGRVDGVVLGDGRRVLAGAVVLTTGTFLRGVIHLGRERRSAGRDADPAAIGLARSIEALGLSMGRLKTGTPPRLDGRTIDWAALQQQVGDDPPEPLSWSTDVVRNRQVACAITWTTPTTHALVRANLGESALFGGGISGVGPRYCPSLEDKVVRFSEKPQHQLFLEPEGLDDDTVYPNGLSTSLPAPIQEAIVQSIPGLERARLIRLGYAIEYDYCDPRRLSPTFELTDHPRLFLAGQINGTTGYEEAAAQGIMAGLNAAQRAAGTAPDRVFGRHEAYLGVLADDLVVQGVTEPYRMLTARAEHRLRLRADNAALRLTARGIGWGCVGRSGAAAFVVFEAAVSEALTRARSESATPHALRDAGIGVPLDGRRRSVLEVLALPPGNDGDVLAVFPWLRDVSARVRQELDAQALYGPYLARQDALIERTSREEGTPLPHDLDYERIPSLSREMRDRLSAARPSTLGAAGRVAGVTPAAVAALSARFT